MVRRNTCSNHIKIRWKRSIEETRLGKTHLGRQSPPVVPESQFRLRVGGLWQEMLVRWAACLWVQSCRKYSLQSEGSEMARTQHELPKAETDLSSALRSFIRRLRARQVRLPLRSRETPARAPSSPGTCGHGTAEGASSTAASCVLSRGGWLPPPSLLTSSAGYWGLGDGVLGQKAGVRMFFGSWLEEECRSRKMTL